MLDSLIPRLSHATAYGSGVYKQLQNDSVPTIDLLIREAIQNSSDASLGIPGDSYRVLFNIHKFVPYEFNSKLSDISDLLDCKYNDTVAECLEIRDEKTSGLTGPVSLAEVSKNQDNHGNYFKLVFDTGKEQTNSSSGEAGGSFGYGKSVYYRAGVGFVVFYSQIQKEDGSFEQRLIISYVEKEGDGALLSKICDRPIGRAWWGKRVQSEDGEEDLLPITNPDEIREILKVFGVREFRRGMTGTSIIIPYIKQRELLNSLYPDDCGMPEDFLKICSFKEDLAEYIKISIQKWYSPKLANENLISIDPSQKMLDARVNDEAIDSDNMKGVFRLIQELYTVAYSAGVSSDSKNRYVSKDYETIDCHPIKVSTIDGKIAGFVAYIKILAEDIVNKTAVPPYAYLRLFDWVNNQYPIVMFARTPGMIMDYKMDGKWVKGIPNTETPNEYFLAFFVPRCNSKMIGKRVKEFDGTSFGEYLRQTEKADHMDWEDPAGLNVIGRIKTIMSNELRHKVKPEESEGVEGKASSLSRRIGKRMLPTLKYGSNPIPTKKVDRSIKLKNVDLRIRETGFASDGMRIKFEAIFKNEKKDAEIGLYVVSESGNMDATAWRKNIMTPFPIRISEISDITIFAKNSNETATMDSDAFICNPAENKFGSVSIITNDNSDVIGFRLSNQITNATVSGTLNIQSNNRTYVCALDEIARKRGE